jgi:hypothetical protein
MKKFLGIVVLGLLLSGNAYASSEKIYLVCPVKATDITRNTGKIIEYIPNLETIINTNYISIYKKKNKIKIVIYEHIASIVWFKFKPEKTLSYLKPYIKTKSEYKNCHFLHTVTETVTNSTQVNFDIYKKENKWIVEGTYNIYSPPDTTDYTFKGDCVEFIKEDFLKARRKGIINYKKS